MSDTGSARRQRGLTQRMYLVNSQVADESASYSVLGSTGNEYRVTYSDLAWACTCPDFVQRAGKCKHAYFISDRVLCGEDPMAATRLLVKSDRDFWAPGIACEGEPRDVNRREHVGECCAVCIETMDDVEPVVFCDRSCGNAVHASCFATWSMYRGRYCVHCRSPM